MRLFLSATKKTKMLRRFLTCIRLLYKLLVMRGVIVFPKQNSSATCLG